MKSAKRYGSSYGMVQDTWASLMELMHLLSLQLEDPFLWYPNELPAPHLQHDFNLRLMLALENYAELTYKAAPKEPTPVAQSDRPHATSEDVDLKKV